MNIQAPYLLALFDFLKESFHNTDELFQFKTSLTLTEMTGYFQGHFLGFL